MLSRLVFSVGSCLTVAISSDSVCSDQAECASVEGNSEHADILSEALWQEAFEMGEDFHLKMLQKSVLAKSTELGADKEVDIDYTIDDDPKDVPYLWLPKMENQSNPFATSPETGPKRCQPSEPCWPTDEQVAAFTESLEPQLKRNLHWKGGMNPRPAPVPLFQANQQPLYGDNKDLKPVYVRDSKLAGMDSAKVCPKPWSSPLCKMSVRNFPTEGWQPAFVVWPLKVAHVQETINFAKRHNLCVAVVGAGHDFLNRHSCNNGILLRMNMLKDVEFNPPNHPKNAVKLGPGLLFQEIVYAAKAENVFLASGWANTVGIIGWSIGGGHGPYAGQTGLGSDNILEADMVLADGSAVTVNETHHPDLLWALRGGGGSTWGVITSLTCKTYPMPEGGITQYDQAVGGSMCGEGAADMNRTVDDYLQWLGGLSWKFSGLGYFAPLAPSGKGKCPTWLLTIKFMFLGGPDEKEFKAFTESFVKSVAKTTPTLSRKVHNYAEVWDRSTPHGTDIMTNGIDPFQYTANGPGLTPSVLVDAETLAGKALGHRIKEKMIGCKTPTGDKWLKCQSLQIYSDIPGTRAKHEFTDSAINANFRKANAHVVLMTDSMEEAQQFYELGAASYFGESAYHMANWKERNFGEKYAKLLSIKKKYDKNNVFWCRHCVGSTD